MIVLKNYIKNRFDVTADVDIEEIDLLW